MKNQLKILIPDLTFELSDGQPIVLKPFKFIDFSKVLDIVNGYLTDILESSISQNKANNIVQSLLQKTDEQFQSLDKLKFIDQTGAFHFVESLLQKTDEQFESVDKVKDGETVKSLLEKINKDLQSLNNQAFLQAERIDELINQANNNSKIIVDILDSLPSEKSTAEMINNLLQKTDDQYQLMTDILALIELASGEKPERLNNLGYDEILSLLVEIVDQNMDFFNRIGKRLKPEEPASNPPNTESLSAA